MTAGRAASPNNQKLADAITAIITMAAREWMRPNTTRAMLYKSISHRSPPEAVRMPVAAF